MLSHPLGTRLHARVADLRHEILCVHVVDRVRVLVSDVGFTPGSRPRSPSDSLWKLELGPPLAGGIAAVGGGETAYTGFMDFGTRSSQDVSAAARTRTHVHS